MYIPAVIKLSNLEKFAFATSQKANGWATSLYVLGTAMEDLPGVIVCGVAPDFHDWYVCFYVSFEFEKASLDILHAALSRFKAEPQECRIVKKAAEFGRRSGYRRAVMRIEPGKAMAVASFLIRDGQSESMVSVLNALHIEGPGDSRKSVAV